MGKRQLTQRPLLLVGLRKREPLACDPGKEDALYRAALAVERDERLAIEMSEWEGSTAGDGL